MSDDGFEIAPAQVPLSHQQSGAKQEAGSSGPPSASTRSWKALLLLAALSAAAIAVLWWVSTQPPSPPSEVLTGGPAAAQPPGTVASNTPSNKQLPPFAQSQLALARQRAQASLAKFVEQQIQLEEQMAVGSWGQSAFDQALAKATEGDELFVDERFEEAQSAYDEATALLAQVIDMGTEQVSTALSEGFEAVRQRDEVAAEAAFARALRIDGDNQDALAGSARAAKLPQIKRKALKARNHELAGQWQEAVAEYQAILALDAETEGISAALAEAEQAMGGDVLRDTLSRGFTALEQGRYTAARTAFNEALQRSPGNDIALGGLQQVSDRTEAGRIARLQKAAAAAVRDEDWESAVQSYESALALDANIQFAKAGLRNAKDQRQAAQLLRQIVSDPNKLSSAELLQQGQDTLANARALQPSGPKLQALIAQASELLIAYAQPVTVRLTSDNETEVLVSTVGKLGTFNNRELSLRPGEYVLLGSRSGCRDVRRTVIVAPGMTPVDIRCEEHLGQ